MRYVSRERREDLRRHLLLSIAAASIRTTYNIVLTYERWVPVRTRT